jgi:hypothetical protein
MIKLKTIADLIDYQTDDLRLEQMLVDIWVPQEYLVFDKEILNTRNADQEKLESTILENKFPMSGSK